MRKLGFQREWIELILKCVMTVNYRIKVNRHLTNKFIPERGLCQEDFAALLNKAEAEGRITGVKICPNAPSISHLLFADDSLILVRANRENAMQLQSILDMYETCSGQVINREKSAVMFSKNTGDAYRVVVKRAMHIEKERVNERYLGLPVSVGQSKTKTFNYLKERVWKRI
ncbi:hypothetical protein U9M48_029297 [Paspalum notatum var. saurae]|uniref:Reverse transcriptase domain-containing protein n=1 Tax=Paspalum notatum var. saurae TaxID=547442 RepID=A0AAQ3TXD1_PASNO